MAVMTVGIGRKIEAKQDSLLWWTIEKHLPRGSVIPIVSIEEVSQQQDTNNHQHFLTTHNPHDTEK
jgi:hypothetical protein